MASLGTSTCCSRTSSTTGASGEDGRQGCAAHAAEVGGAERHNRLTLPPCQPGPGLAAIRGLPTVVRREYVWCLLAAHLSVLLLHQGSLSWWYSTWTSSGWLPGLEQFGARRRLRAHAISVLGRGGKLSVLPQPC